jgi:protease-4
LHFNKKLKLLFIALKIYLNQDDKLMKFFLQVLATIVGMFLFFVVGFFLLVGLVGVLSSEQPVTVKENSVLKLNLNRPIVEQAVDNPFGDLGMFGLDAGSPLGLVELIQTIDAAATDDRISGIYLESGMPMAGFASLSEIRAALDRFKAEGKFVVSYSEIYTEAGYYVASISDAVHIFPEGDLDIRGLSSEFVSIKNTLDKIGVKPEIFRVGDYKSAIEPFINETMSPENREQTTAFINSIYETMLDRMAASRGISKERMTEISDEYLARTPQLSVELGLVDRTSYYDEVLSDLKERVGIDEDEDLTTISMGSYMKAKPSPEFSSNKIAVLIANGDIVSGSAPVGTIASESLSKEIRKLRDDDGIKAVVLRVNSPGGSALASDAIWREINLLKEKKPVVASFGDVAASGGYYISMNTDYIVAEPTSITGSIGVFSLFFNAEDLLRDKLGVQSEYIGTGRYSNLFGLNRSMTDAERVVFQEGVDRFYETFTTKAAEGREMELQSLLAVASGRVWSGVQAKENGLVDELGGLDTAIKKAAELAELDDYRVLNFPPKVDFFQQLIESLDEDLEVRFAKAKLGELYPIAESVKKLNEYKGIQARMPFEVKFQ